MDRKMSGVDFDPWAECGSLKSGFAMVFGVPRVMLLDAFRVDETSDRIAGTLD
jgi:hypothetical protein